MQMKKALSLLLMLAFAAGYADGGIQIVKSNGISLTAVDGINYVGTSGITLTGADGFLTFRSNGITLTGADGITLTGADGIAPTFSNGGTYVGSNGITLTGADGITLTGADGITLTGADGITLTGADGTQYRADSLVVRRPNGITLTGADGITLTGADGITLTGADGGTRVGPNGITLTGADGITLTGADGITLTGADGIILTGADSLTGFTSNGIAFDQVNPAGITLTGADGITLTGADGITLTGADGITLTGVDGITLTGADDRNGLQSVDPDLAVKLNNASDDSNINAIIVFHQAVSESDLQSLREIGILGGTRLRVLPMVYVTATKTQLLAVSRLSTVRSLYGNRTLTFNSDPFFKPTGIERVFSDSDLRTKNNAIPVSGRNVTVAVLDTGINGLHPDLAGRIVQNVRLSDTQSAPAGFVNPIPVENLANTDLTGGHGTFVAGVIAASGASSNGKFSGVASGARLLGLSAGDLNLTYVLSGFDYLLDRAAQYNVRVLNCSFSAEAVYDKDDPVNIATKMLTDRGVNVVFSAGNSGSGNGTLNPYASAPWVIGVGATNPDGRLASYSSRGNFGDDIQHPSLVAPGTNIASLRSSATANGTTGLGGADTDRLNVSEMPYYTTGSGTSFSAPQVAGAIALMLEVNPQLTPSEIKDILSRTATPLPKYFFHEVGAGMLNTHSAVIEAAFPDRQMGAFRSVLSRNSVKFVRSVSQTFTRAAFPFATASTDVPIPPDTVQANISIAWNLSANDFGMKLFDSYANLAGESNYLNLPVLAGRSEKITLRNPLSQTFRADVRHTGGAGTSQDVYGVVELIKVDYPDLLDLSSMSVESLSEAKNSLLTNVVLPEGQKFRPNSSVTRLDFADAFVRSGLVPQYISANALFTDVRDNYSRNAVESVQSNPSGRLIADAAVGGRFYPNNATSKLIAAVAYVKAAKLDSLAASSSLPLYVADASSIPAELRGFVAVALQNGFISLDGNQFKPGRAVTRIELSVALNKLINY